VFDITTSGDFYAMLVQDFDDFMAEQHSSRRALHCAITAYHLGQWVWRDWLKDDHVVKKVLGISSENSFYNWINQTCVWFAPVRDLTNGTKHFNQNQSFGTIRIHGGPLGLGPSGQGCLLIDYGEGAGELHRFQPVAHLLEIVVRFWRDFFWKYRPNMDLPESRYHVDGDWAMRDNKVDAGD
jgi:hypothetical protein